MKKILGRILKIIVFLVLEQQMAFYYGELDFALRFQNVSFGYPIISGNLINSNKEIFLVIMFIGIFVLPISILSYFILKVIARKEQNKNEKTMKRIHLNKKMIDIIVAIFIIIISLAKLDEIENVFLNGTTDLIGTIGLIVKIGLIITIVFILVSIILIIKEKKKVITTIAIIMGILLIGCTDVLQDLREKDKEKYLGGLDIHDYSLRTFNDQFALYAGEEVRGPTVRALIFEVLSNNVSRTDDELMQVPISGVITLNKEDTELPEQFDEIKWDKTYNVNMIYNKYGKIESIHIEENQ